MFLWYKQINNDQIYALESMMSYLAWNECVEVLFLHYLKKRSTFPLKCRLEWNMLPLRRFPAFSSRERQWRLCFCASLEFFFLALFPSNHLLRELWFSIVNVLYLPILRSVDFSSPGYTWRRQHLQFLLWNNWDL